MNFVGLPESLNLRIASSVNSLGRSKSRSARSGARASTASTTKRRQRIARRPDTANGSQRAASPPGRGRTPPTMTEALLAWFTASSCRHKNPHGPAVASVADLPSARAVFGVVPSPV
jgi:hypothetical protein